MKNETKANNINNDNRNVETFRISADILDIARFRKLGDIGECLLKCIEEVDKSANFFLNSQGRMTSV